MSDINETPMLEGDLEESPLIAVAMQIILHAGDARNFAIDALEAAKKADLAAADELIAKADVEILEAHKSQTHIIQSAMGGEDYGYSLLFAHAQDTLMTIMSEIRMSKQLIDVLRIVYSQR